MINLKIGKKKIGLKIQHILLLILEPIMMAILAEQKS